MVNRILRPAVAALALALGGSALAAPGAPPFDIRGSDTLFEILGDAMAQYNAQCSAETWFQPLRYIGTGSGNGERAMTRSPATYANNWQLLAPMSRNLTAATLALCPNSSCAPELRNVLGLDGGVFVQRNQALGYAKCPNLGLGTDPADIKSAPRDNLMALVLGGKGGTGTREACRHPDRVAAINTLLSCYTGPLNLTHWYRRDDASGTTDTFKEKLKIDRFCNGTAPGTGGLNTANQDLDPIRFDCPGADASFKAVSCTFTDPADTANFGRPCQATPTAPGCTAGFVIALSQGDAGFDVPAPGDVTATIGNRVGTDPTLSTLGYAGREAVRLPGRPTAAPQVNGLSASDELIRANNYMLARRLWLHDRIVQSDPNLGDVSLNPTLSCADPDSTALPAHTPDAGCAAGRDATEGSVDANGVTTGFFFWATDTFPSLNCANAQTGRQIMGPILRRRGFLSCMSDDSEPPVDGTNLCGLFDAPGGAGFAVAQPAIPNLVFNAVVGGAYTPATCAANQICWSDGSVCPVGGGTCPVPPARPAGWVCVADAECSSGVCDPFVRTCL